MSKNYYSILNLPEGAALDEIKRAYRKLALQHHPDINPTPEAHELFIEISHAYEYLLEKTMHEINSEATYEYNFDDEYAEILKEIKNESRARAQKQREMRKEAERKRNEEFQKSGLYDISLLIRYFLHYLSVFLGFGLILFPVYISFTQDIAAFFYLFYFWLVGLFLLLYIYSQRRTWFKLGTFYFKWKNILELLQYKNENPEEICQYCKNFKANSFSFKHTMLIIRDIQLKNRGPLQHDARYKRDYIEIAVPRSRKAFIIHVLTSLIKILSVLLSFIFLPIESLVWKFLIGALAGGIIATLLLLITATRSCTTYLLNPTLLIKLLIWLGLIISLTKFNNNLNITTSEYTLVSFTITSFFIDFFIDPIAGFIFKKQLWKPIFKQAPQISRYFESGYQNNLEIPVWSTLYPLLRWFF
jgi:hypothetical protein